jgi:DNA-directed RNA polymerase I, II, and III subunit RPABC2
MSDEYYGESEYMNDDLADDVLNADIDVVEADADADDVISEVSEETVSDDDTGESGSSSDDSNDDNDLIDAVADAEPVRHKISRPYMTKYERASAIGLYAQQVAEGRPLPIDVGSRTDPIEIAEYIMEVGAMAFDVDRRMPNRKGQPEVYRLNHLVNLLPRL